MTIEFDNEPKILTTEYVDYNIEDVDEFDLIIIGGGAGGFSAATKAFELGLKAIIINGGLPIGGTCVNVGCVPSKILIELSNKYYYTKHPNYDSLKGKCSNELILKDVIAEKNTMVNSLRQSNYVDVANDLKGIKNAASVPDNAWD